MSDRLKAKVCAKLGLPASATDTQVMYALCKRDEERRVARDELALTSRNIAVSAANEGRIPANRIEFWTNALIRDPSKRELLESIEPAAPQPRSVAAAQGSVQDAESKIFATMNRLGMNVTAPPPAPAKVAAAAAQASVPVDKWGAPTRRIPEPVRMVHGKDPRTWTKRERDDALIYRTIPRLRGVVPPPPGGEGIFYPSPNDPYEWVETGDGQGEFRPKPEFRGSGGF
jgi:hypothetical protein